MTDPPSDCGAVHETSSDEVVGFAAVTPVGAPGASIGAVAPKPVVAVMDCWLIPSTPGTVIGTVCAVPVRLPSSPRVFPPQHLVAPVANTTHECVPPTARATAVLSRDVPSTSVTVTGVRLVPGPEPNSLRSSPPQHFTAPVANNAHVCASPKETAMAVFAGVVPSMSGTATGVLLALVVPSPS